MAKHWAFFFYYYTSSFKLEVHMKTGFCENLILKSYANLIKPNQPYWADKSIGDL